MSGVRAKAWVAPPTADATSAEDPAAIEAAVLDYFEGWFDGDVQRAWTGRCIPALAKHALGQDADRAPRPSTSRRRTRWSRPRSAARPGSGRDERLERSGSTSRRLGRHRERRSSTRRVYVEYVLLARDRRRLADHQHAVAVGRRPWSARRLSAAPRPVERGRAARRADRGPGTPTDRASSSETASASSTRSTATGEPTILLLPTWSIIHSRLWKLQIPYLARRSPGASRSTGAATAGRTGPTDPEAYARGASSPRMRSPSWTRPAPSAPSSSPCRWARSGRCSSPRSTPNGSPGSSSSRRPSRCRRRRARVEGDHEFDGSRSTATRAGRSTTATTGARLRGLPRVLLRAMLHRAALDEADRGRRRLGPRDGRRDARSPTQLAPGLEPEADVRALLCPRSAARCLVIHGSDDHVRHVRIGCALAELATGASSSSLEGGGPHPQCPRPGPGQPAASATSSDPSRRSER